MLDLPETAFGGTDKLTGDTAIRPYRVGEWNGQRANIYDTSANVAARVLYSPKDMALLDNIFEGDPTEVGCEFQEMLNRLAIDLTNIEYLRFKQFLNTERRLYTDLSLQDYVTEVLSEGEQIDPEDVARYGDIFCANFYDEAAIKVDQWLKNLHHKGFYVGRHVLVGEPKGPVQCRLNILQIGESQSGRLYDIESLYNSLVEVCELLGISKIDTPLNVYLLSDCYPDIYNDFYPNPDYKTERPSLTTGFYHLANASGGANYSHIYVSSASGTYNPKLFRYQIDAERVEQIQRHELAHLIAPFRDFSQYSHREGFSTMIEHKCNFAAMKNECRLGWGYTNEVSIPLLVSIIDNKASGSSSILPEAYLISGSLFAFLFQKLGRDNFFDFYGLITGGLCADEHNNIYHSPMPFEDDTTRSFGFIDALTIVIGDTQSAESIIQEYMAEMNS